MAHECPDCYQWCHCGGDIDDMFMSGTDEEAACGHCPFFDDDPDMLTDEAESLERYDLMTEHEP
jgi:hypothetical protein